MSCLSCIQYLRVRRAQGGRTREDKEHAEIWAKVIHVYDGDTITVLTVSPSSSTHWTGACAPVRAYRVRLKGFDCAEMRPRLDCPDREGEKAKAMCAKVRMEELVLNKCVRIDVFGRDKYGRLLGSFQAKGLDGTVSEIADLMIQEGHAYAYDGGTKTNMSANT